jgi:hypothetical protein
MEKSKIMNKLKEILLDRGKINLKRNMKLLTIIAVIVLIPTKVLAHPGRLDSSGCHTCRTNCPSWGLEYEEYHCHSGNTYTNSKGEVYNEKGVLLNNNTSSNNESNNNDSNNTSSNNKSDNNNLVNNNQSGVKQVAKSDDTSLKYVKINNKPIVISETMTYETTGKNIDLDIKANDNKATVEFNISELNTGENEVIIKVTAEAGNIKEYKLIITKNEVISNVVIKEFILGASKVDFKNNKATINKLANESSFKYSYKLSSISAKLLLYLNDKEVTKLDNIKDKDIIKLVVVDKDDNKNTYEIEVKEMSKLESAIINIISYTLVIAILLSPIIIVIVIKYNKKKKG